MRLTVHLGHEGRRVTLFPASLQWLLWKSDLFLLIEEQQNSVTSFANQVQNAVKHAQRNIALQETTFLPSVSIPKVIRNTVDK